MNHKGFTTVEVLVCFIIVSIVTMTMFSTISSFNDRRIQETNRAKIYEYKNEVTNLIQEDIVKRGVLFASVSMVQNDVAEKKYKLDLTFGDGTVKTLEVYQRFTQTDFHPNGINNQDDSFYINYGLSSDLIRYELPNLGYTNGYYDTATSTYTEADIMNSCGEGVTCYKAYDLQISDVRIYVTNESDPSLDSHILVIYIGFSHPDFGSRYAIDIVAPLNYQASIADSGNPFPTTTSDMYSDTAIYYPSPSPSPTP